ncbi:hypothetical protein NC796_24945 [Aliifodinibius sp. S!AR15-10]|uniref:hypothetical protein n=1 Tax=Aliifodinibius sp. S!AR15-10 TaxID=2950437 RepID=UPI0028632D59|nr:hypothetical protein [Aliifodinibius sp. S!AR15-10]MDR8394418.1 hypothetical protein [Aliifodinibius sp. S!AR15-10]
MSTRERVIINELPEDVEYRFVRDRDNPPPYSSLGRDQSTTFQPGHYYLELKVEEGSQISTSFHHFITVQSVTAEPGNEGNDLYFYHLIVPDLQEDTVEGGDEDIALIQPDGTEE